MPGTSSSTKEFASEAAPISQPRRGVWRRIYQFFARGAASNWLQLSVIAALFGAAVFVMLNERYLWGVLLAVAGGAFGLSFILRRMVGDQYGRA